MFLKPNGFLLAGKVVTTHQRRAARRPNGFKSLYEQSAQGVNTKQASAHIISATPHCRQLILIIRLFNNRGS